MEFDDFKVGCLVITGYDIVIPGPYLTGIVTAVHPDFIEVDFDSCFRRKTLDRRDWFDNKGILSIIDPEQVKLAIKSTDDFINSFY